MENPKSLPAVRQILLDIWNTSRQELIAKICNRQVRSKKDRRLATGSIRERHPGAPVGWLQQSGIFKSAEQHLSKRKSSTPIVPAVEGRDGMILNSENLFWQPGKSCCQEGGVAVKRKTTEMPELNLQLTRKQQEILLRGLRFVRSSVALEPHEYSDTVEQARGSQYAEIAAVESLLKTATIVETAAV